MPPEAPPLIGPPAGWPVEAGAAISTRLGGVSPAPWDSLDLGDHVGDEPARVAENRRRWAAVLGARPVYLKQVHGTLVVRLDSAVPAEPPEADAAITTERGIACTVLVADCLPVLFAAPGGVGAAHAGWRGLAGGVLEKTVEALCAATGSAPRELQAWLGPCIGPEAFEVGADVLAAFPDAAGERFRPRRGMAGKWDADLAGLARDRLVAAGVGRVEALGACTVAEGGRFYSYRREGVTGRMAAAVWRR